MKFERKSHFGLLSKTVFVLFLMSCTFCADAPAAKPAADAGATAVAPANTTPAPDLYPRSCYRELLTSYGLEGTPEPVNGESPLPLCPSVRMSCCSMRDQQRIYLKWVRGREAAALNARLEDNIRIYQNLFDSLIEAQNFASNMKKSIVKKVANCRLLADRLLSFEITEVKDQAIRNLLEAKQFFLDTYKGFYCTLCDYENHRFFDPLAKSITFKQDFCRDIVRKNLPNLLLFHVDIVKVINLAARLLTTCGPRGEYNMEAVVPPKVLVTENAGVSKQLSDCRANRNTASWFYECQGICSKFSLVNFSPFFEPRLKAAKAFTRFARDRLKSSGAKATSAPVTMGIFSNSTSSDDKKKASTTNAGASKSPKKDDKNASTTDAPKLVDIFKTSILPTVDLKPTVFTYLFAPFGGISTYENGQNSALTEVAYAQVATQLELADNSEPLLDIGTGYTGNFDASAAFSQHPGYASTAMQTIVSSRDAFIINALAANERKVIAANKEADLKAAQEAKAKGTTTATSRKLHNHKGKGKSKNGKNKANNKSKKSSKRVSKNKSRHLKGANILQGTLIAGLLALFAAMF